MFLWGRGYRNAYTLLGGLDAWKDEVLFPLTPAQATAEERARFERTLQVARFFGGQARTPASQAGAPVGMPKLEASAPPVPPPAPSVAGPGSAAPKKKKREGC
jgi:hypothetical protein